MDKAQYQREMTEIYQKQQAALLEAEKRIHAEAEGAVLALRQKYGLPLFRSPDEL
jgi:hypothetical protein